MSDLRQTLEVFNFEQGTPEWVQMRLGKFTASTAQAIAAKGKGLETLVYEKVAEILTGKQKEQYTNADIERGKELEAKARNTYEIDTGIVASRVGFVKIHDHIGCSPDGMIEDKGLLELKCVNDTNFVRFLHTEVIETKYMWQMQFQMWVTEREWVDYGVYNDNFPNPLKVIRVPRNEVQIEKIKSGLNMGLHQLSSILEKVK